MALQLDALSASSGMMPSSNGVLNGAPSHSPLSSDSGFHSDQIGAEQQQQQRTAPPLRTKNIFHKPTYDSVFATDPDTNTIFDKFDRRFQTNRPHCLSNPLRFPKSDDENRSKSPVAAPVIVPTRLTMSTGSRTPTSPFYTASSTSRECDSLANFSLPSPHQQSHESLLHQDSGSSEERFMSSSITESFASGTAAALKQQPPALPHEPPPSAPTSTQYITSTNVSIQLSPTSASYNHPSPPVSPLKPKLSLQTTARTPDLPTMTITSPGATLSTAAVIGEIPHHVLAYNDEEIATAELVDYAINSSEQVSQSAQEVMVERETERSAEHKLKLIEEGEDMTELKDKVDSKEALVEAVEEEQEPSELLGRDSELSYCKSIKETPSPAFGEHVQLTSFARSTGFARPDVEYEHADAKLDKTAEYPNIAPAHEDSSTANFGTKSSSVNLSSPSFGAAKFSSWSINKFSQNDNGAPVMPAPRGVAAMVHSSVPSSYSRTSTSTRGLRTSEWRISSSTASANLPQSPPPRFTAVTSSSYGSLSQKSDDSSNLHETSPPKVVSSSHENPSVRVTALHWSSQESLPKAITVASSSEECPEQKATSIPSNLHENPPSRGGISTLPRLTSPVKSTFSSEASSPITRSSDVQFEKNHTSPRYSFRNEFDETNTLSYPYTSVDSKDPMMTINKQSPVETFAEHSEVASARTFESSYQSDRRNIARPNTIAQQVLSSASVPTQSSVLPPNDSASKQRSSFVGLDFSRYEVAEEDIIGRPVEADESEQNAILFAKEFYSKSAACSRGKPTEQQLAQCKEILGSESFADYDIFTVNLKRSANSPEGSVGIILTSAATGDKYILVIISVQKVITGSIADHSDYIDRGDRVFFIQDRSTRMVRYFLLALNCIKIILLCFVFEMILFASYYSFFLGFITFIAMIQYSFTYLQ
ncbi:unnamed protein product [Toxocara canis]|uniref:PDZ domain-containing protein n=1 Tax=Toxocara canis TaxID=6265 RepID=A0A183TUU9_TOXCA|nr:unnamed protein product [Toxocara canis]